MKPAPFALVVLALLVALAWPISSAIGAATAGAAAREAIRAAACAPDQRATAPTDGWDDDEEDGVALPPGHPPIGGQLPPGHPPISADGLPPGHPPIGHLPPGHPPLPSGRTPAAPSPVELFGSPVLLTI